MYKLQVDSLRVAARLGCTDNEQAFPQLVTVSLVVGIGDDTAMISDSVEAMVSYVDFVEIVEGLCQKRVWRLAEKMAFDISSELYGRFAPIVSTDVRILKTNVLKSAQGIGAQLQLTREEFQRLRGVR